MEAINNNGGRNYGWILLAWLWGMLLLIAILSTSCTRTEYVEVPKVHTEYIHNTDSILMIDTIIDHQTTIVKELDSVAMAEFGIKLENAQKAWLVEKNQLQKEVSKHQETKSDTIIVTDTIGVPYPVIQYVEKHLSWWQSGLMFLGLLPLLGVFIFIGVKALAGKTTL